MKRGLITVVSDTVNAAIKKAQATAESATTLIASRDTKFRTDMAAMRKDMADGLSQLRSEIPKPDTPATGAVHVEYRDNVTVPAIVSLLGTATVDVSVTWDEPFPDDKYMVTAYVIAGAALIGKTSAEPKSQTATGCVITVTTTAVLAAGSAKLKVVAYRKG